MTTLAETTWEPNQGTDAADIDLVVSVPTPLPPVYQTVQTADLALAEIARLLRSIEQTLDAIQRDVGAMRRGTK